jgi:hypothetical protein
MSRPFGSRFTDLHFPDILPLCFSPSWLCTSHVTDLYMTAVIPFIGVWGFKCRNALNLLSTESPISRFTIFRWMTFLSGNLPTIAIGTTRPLEWTVLAASGFSPWKFPMPRYDEMTSVGSHTELSSFRRIRLHDFEL